MCHYFAELFYSDLYEMVNALSQNPDCKNILTYIIDFSLRGL